MIKRSGAEYTALCEQITYRDTQKCTQQEGCFARMLRGFLELDRKRAVMKIYWRNWNIVVCVWEGGHQSDTEVQLQHCRYSAITQRAKSLKIASSRIWRDIFFCHFALIHFGFHLVFMLPTSVHKQWESMIMHHAVGAFAAKQPQHFNDVHRLTMSLTSRVLQLRKELAKNWSPVIFDSILIKCKQANGNDFVVVCCWWDKVRKLNLCSWCNTRELLMSSKQTFGSELDGTEHV